MRKDEKKWSSSTSAEKRGEREKERAAILKGGEAREYPISDMVKTAACIIRGEDFFVPSARVGKRKKKGLLPFLLGCLFSALLYTAILLIFAI